MAKIDAIDQRIVKSTQAIAAAIQHHTAGRVQEAERIYRQVLTEDATNFDALHLLGVVAHQSGSYGEALEMFDRALVANPLSADAYRNRAETCRMLGRLEDAQKSYENAIAIEPRDAEAHNDLGITLAARGQYDAALARFEHAIACKPNFLEAHLNLGSTYQDLGRLSEAVRCFHEVLKIGPESGLAYIKLGRALQLSGRLADALEKYQEGLAIDPDVALGHFYLGRMLHDQGLLEDALQCFSAAVRLRPNDVVARWALAMSQLALVHEAQDRADDSRLSFARALVELDAWLDSSRSLEGADAVGQQQPFYLAYHETNNRELLSRYGDLCSRLTGFWQECEGIAPVGRPFHEKVRVGFVSGQVRDHSVWQAILKGWLQHLDRERFAVYLFHTGRHRDAETSFAEAHVDYFSQPPRSIRGWVDDIVGHQIDVLIYPEIGMDATTLKLASMRLAPVQAAAWGHPETTGLPTIDYYLSAEDFEPDNAQDNYRERLVALPHLGCRYDPLPVNDCEIDLEEMGIDPRFPILLCAGVPFKYGPQHDWILIEVAKRLHRCQFIFFRHVQENLTEKLECRLESAFENAGLFFHAHGVFLPWLRRDAFYALMRKADVYLDTLGFSGFNTAMQAIECGLPVVTKDGRFMRGRLASGILKRLGMPELVARSDTEYIDLAVRLASDKSYGESIRKRIEADRHVLFNDMAPIRGLEEFLERCSEPQAL